MSIKRVSLVAACALGLVVASGAGAAGTPKVFSFTSQHGILTWIPALGGSPADAVKQVGSTAALTMRIANASEQFGKPAGTTVGRILLDCRLLSVPSDGLCTGIVHVPNGYFLIGGNGPFTTGPRHYAITGGIGPYANARGEVTIATTAAQTSQIGVMLLP